MEIHAPEKPIHSFKDFATHIAIVTVGILIALGLEGIRETVHNRHLVHETRESFRDEMADNSRSMGNELPRIQHGLDQVHALIQQLPTLAEQHPEQVAAQLQAIHNPGYFFSTNSWQAALSTGALALMPPKEVSMYAWSAETTKTYKGLQDKVWDSHKRATAFWQAHPHPNTDQIATGIALIQEFAMDQDALVYVAPQTMSGFRNTANMAGQ